MKKTWRSILILGSVGVLTVFSFQNCAGGFAPLTGSNNESSTSTGPTINNTGTLSAQVYDSGGVDQVDATSLAVGTTYMLHASGSGIDNATVNWNTNSANNAAACTVTGTGNALVESISCTSAGASEVDIVAYFADGTTANATFPLMVVSAPSAGTPTSSDPNSINFTIAAGTGNNPWNTSASPIVAYVGQTLHIVNADTQFHRMHTNGAPCIHQPTNSAPGQYYDCVLTTAHDPTKGDNYDHDVGTSAAFYVQVLDGAALYSSSNCAACHGALANSAKKGATFTEIKDAIATQPAMEKIVLTDDQIKAIAYNLDQ